MNDGLQRLRGLLAMAAPRTRLGLVGPAEVRRVRTVLARAEEEASTLSQALQAGEGSGSGVALDAYRDSISAFNAAQPNAPLLDAIRAYNHTVIDALDRCRPIRGASLLDVGASPHGYALERALGLGAAAYVGIGLDVHEPTFVSGPGGFGELRKADAEALPFDDGAFDLIVSMSTFEHVAHVDRVLSELWRVLKPGGKALITFEPIWTCSYGHHLHHFGPVSRLVPDWAHLVWSKAEMLASLADVWPSDASPSLEDAIAWVYDGDAINRVGVREMRRFFEASPFTIDWTAPLADSGPDRARLETVSRQTGFTAEELMTKGLSVLLSRS